MSQKETTVSPFLTPGLTSGAQHGPDKVKALPASGRRRLLCKTVVVAQSGTLAQPVEQPPVKRPVGSSSLPRPAQGVCKRHCRTEGWKGSNPLRPFCLFFKRRLLTYSPILFWFQEGTAKAAAPSFLFFPSPYFSTKKRPRFSRGLLKCFLIPEILRREVHVNSVERRFEDENADAYFFKF